MPIFEDRTIYGEDAVNVVPPEETEHPLSRYIGSEPNISRRVYDYLTERYPRTHYFPFFLK